MSAVIVKMVPTRKKEGRTSWRCKCGHWQEFGVWYIAHAHLEVTGACEACGKKYDFYNYTGVPSK